MHIMHVQSTLLSLAFAGQVFGLAMPAGSSEEAQRIVPAASPVPKFNPKKLDSSATVNPPAAVNSVNDFDGVGSLPNKARTSYSGDGTSGQGWPAISQWESFQDMWNNNLNNIRIGCDFFQVPRNSESEITSLRNAIESVAASSRVDHRLILAVVMQESNGCVRVPTTIAPGTNPPLFNPGLMQDSQGFYRCNCQTNDNFNEQCGLVIPCPDDTIHNMIREGAVGTDTGEGLASLLNDAQNAGTRNEQTFYVAANWYNQGRSVPVGAALSAYAVNIANRLTGWLGP